MRVPSHLKIPLPLGGTKWVLMRVESQWLLGWELNIGPRLDDPLNQMNCFVMYLGRYQLACGWPP